MHEFSLCQQIIKQVEVAIEDKKKIVSVSLSIGDLAAIDVDSLQFWFPVASKSTRLASANLMIEKKTAWAKCLSCCQRFALIQRLSGCPACQSFQYQLLSGNEMLIKHVEVL